MTSATLTPPVARELSSAVPAPPLCDDLFDGASLRTYHQDDHFNQRCADGGSRIVCETVMRARGAVEDAVALVRGPWIWWDHGRVLSYREGEKGVFVQVLAPIWWNSTRIHQEILQPVPLPGLDGVRVPIIMTHHLVGPATIDVFNRPGVPGEIIVRGRFHNVENHLPLIPMPLAAYIHLRTEAGNFIPKNGGWRGLLRFVEAGADNLGER